MYKTIFSIGTTVLKKYILVYNKEVWYHSLFTFKYTGFRKINNKMDCVNDGVPKKIFFNFCDVVI